MKPPFEEVEIHPMNLKFGAANQKLHHDGNQPAFSVMNRLSHPPKALGLFSNKDARDLGKYCGKRLYLARALAQAKSV